MATGPSPAPQAEAPSDLDFKYNRAEDRTERTHEVVAALEALWFNNPEMRKLLQVAIGEERNLLKAVRLLLRDEASQISEDDSNALAGICSKLEEALNEKDRDALTLTNQKQIVSGGIYTPLNTNFDDITRAKGKLTDVARIQELVKKQEQAMTLREQIVRGREAEQEITKLNAEVNLLASDPAKATELAQKRDRITVLKASEEVTKLGSRDAELKVLATELYAEDNKKVLEHMPVVVETLLELIELQKSARSLATSNGSAAGTTPSEQAQLAFKAEFANTVGADHLTDSTPFELSANIAPNLAELKAKKEASSAELTALQKVLEHDVIKNIDAVHEALEMAVTQLGKDTVLPQLQKAFDGANARATTRFEALKKKKDVLGLKIDLPDESANIGRKAPQSLTQAEQTAGEFKDNAIKKWEDMTDERIRIAGRELDDKKNTAEKRVDAVFQAKVLMQFRATLGKATGGLNKPKKDLLDEFEKFLKAEDDTINSFLGYQNGETLPAEVAKKKQTYLEGIKSRLVPDAKNKADEKIEARVVLETLTKGHLAGNQTATQEFQLDITNYNRARKGIEESIQTLEGDMSHYTALYERWVANGQAAYGEIEALQRKIDGIESETTARRTRLVEDIDKKINERDLAILANELERGSAIHGEAEAMQLALVGLEAEVNDEGYVGKQNKRGFVAEQMGLERGKGQLDQALGLFNNLILRLKSQKEAVEQRMSLLDQNSDKVVVTAFTTRKDLEKIIAEISPKKVP
jgi:hypothetical protein